LLQQTVPVAAKLQLDLLRQKQSLMQQQIDQQKVNSTCLHLAVSVFLLFSVSLIYLSTTSHSFIEVSQVASRL